MPPPKRSEIQPGQRVQIVEKQNQRTGALTNGIIAQILTRSASHPHGIKVRLTDGRIGRVQAILAPATSAPRPQAEAAPGQTVKKEGSV